MHGTLERLLDDIGARVTDPKEAQELVTTSRDVTIEPERGVATIYGSGSRDEPGGLEKKLGY